MFEIAFHRSYPKHAITFDEWHAPIKAATGATITGMSSGMIHIDFRNGNVLRCLWAEHTPQEALDYAIENGLIMRRPAREHEREREHLAALVAKLPAAVLPEAARMLSGMMVPLDD